MLDVMWERGRRDVDVGNVRRRRVCGKRKYDWSRRERKDGDGMLLDGVEEENGNDRMMVDERDEEAISEEECDEWGCKEDDHRMGIEDWMIFRRKRRKGRRLN